MRIVVASDEPYPVQEAIVAELERRGHEVARMGAVSSSREEPWVDVAERAASEVVEGRCAFAVLSCWTGTGVSIAANKLRGVRAALCTDAGTAAGARVWNQANVLCLSNRLLSADLAKEILAAWLDTDPGTAGADAVRSLTELEGRS